MDQIGNFFGGDKKRKSKVRKGESLICFKDTPLKYYGLFLCSVLIWGTIVWLMVLADCDLQEFVTSFCFNLLRFDVFSFFLWCTKVYDILLKCAYLRMNGIESYI